MSGITRTAGTAPPGPLVRLSVTRLLRTAAALGAAVLLVAGCGSSSSEDSGYATLHGVEDGTAGSPFHGTPVAAPYHLPKADWTDTDGAMVSWPRNGLPAPVTVVFFAYTSCPDVCPTQLADLTQALRGADVEVRDDVAVVVVTVDPERDDAATLRAYLDRYDTTLERKYVGLRSDDLDMVGKAAGALGVALTGSTTSSYGYEVGHGAQLIGFGPDGTAPVIWLPGTPVGDIRADLTTLARGDEGGSTP